MAFQLHRFCFLNHLVQFFSSDRYQRFRYTLTAAVAVKLGRHGIVDHKVHVSKQFFKNLLRSQALVKECGNGIDFCQTLLQFFNDFLIAERHQLLLTAPVKISDIILGKYLALLTIYVIPVLIMCLYPLLLGTHGTVSYAVSYTSILGYFLLGAAYISVGVFVSSITESQVIAAVVSFVILFLCYVESGIANFFPEGAGSSFFAFFIIIALVCLWIGSMIKNPIITGVIAVIGEGALTAVYFTKSTLLEGKIQDLLGVFNMAGHMDNFVNGILDISGVVYYLSVIAICIFLAMQSLQKKRWN